MSEEEWLALNGERVAYGCGIGHRGVRRGGAAGQPTPSPARCGSATGSARHRSTVRGDAGAPAGFSLVEAGDMDEALEAAAGIPPARFGSVEVRPVRPLPVPPAETT